MAGRFTKRFLIIFVAEQSGRSGRFLSGLAQAFFGESQYPRITEERVICSVGKPVASNRPSLSSSMI